MSRLQKKPPAHKRGHPTLQNMNFFYFCGSFFALLDPDSEYGSGSTGPIEYGSGSGSETLIRIVYGLFMWREELPEVDCYSFVSLMVSPPADTGLVYLTQSRRYISVFVCTGKSCLRWTATPSCP
jgi:hypothetical protein